MSKVRLTTLCDEDGNTAEPSFACKKMGGAVHVVLQHGWTVKEYRRQFGTRYTERDVSVQNLMAPTVKGLCGARVYTAPDSSDYGYVGSFPDNKLCAGCMKRLDLNDDETVSLLYSPDRFNGWYPPEEN